MPSENTKKPIRVLIVYHFFAAYRHAVLSLLNSDPRIELTLVSSFWTKEGIRGIDHEGTNSPFCSFKHLSVRNIWIPHQGSPVLWQVGLFKILRSGNYDTVIFLGSVYYLTTWLGCLYARFRGIPTLFWTHGFRGKEGILSSFLRSLFYKLPNSILVYGNRGKRLVVERTKISESRIKVVFNSLDYDEHIEARKFLTSQFIRDRRRELFHSEPDGVVCYIGRVHPNKKLDILISCLSILQRSGKKICAIIIGNGPALNDLKIQSREQLSDGTVQFLGAKYGLEASLLVGLGDVCVVPGPVGLTAVHSLALGVPVVTNDDFNFQKPEYEAIVDSVNGSFYKINCAKDLASKVEFWCQKMDSNRHLIKEECYKVIDEDYNPQRQAEEIIKAVLELNYRDE